MSFTVTRSAQLGRKQFGKSQLGKIENYQEDIPGVFSDGTRRGQTGFGHMGARQWGRTEVFDLSRQAPPTTGAKPIVKLVSSTGAVLGEIRTDTAKTIFRSLNFTIVREDCRDFVLTLNKPPSFPLLPFAFVQIQTPDAPRGMYYGKVTQAPEKGDGNQDKFEFRGVGLSEELSGINDDGRSWPAGTDVGEAVRDLAVTQVANETSIGVDVSRINTNTGAVFAGNVTLDRSSLKTTIQRFAEWAGHDFGVDGQGVFFFLPYETGVTRTVAAGFDVHEVKVDRNIEDIRNRVVGTRTNPIGAGGAGWVVGAISISVPSIRKFLTRELTEKFPGNATDSDIQSWTDAILEQRKDPKYSAVVKNWNFRTYADYVLRGSTCLILPYDEYEVEYEPCDDPTTTFAKIGAGDLTVEENTTDFVDGAASLRLTWTTTGDRVESVAPLNTNILKLRFYYRANQAGELITVGVGQGVWNDVIKPIKVTQAAVGLWVPFEFDISAEKLISIDRVGFEVSGAGTIGIDRINFIVEGSRHLVLSNEKEVYKIDGSETSVTMEKGPVPNRLENFLRELNSRVNEARFAGEIR